jgi:hypothetical protein
MPSDTTCPPLKTAPVDSLRRVAERDEERFCSLLLKSEDCLRTAAESGIQPDWLWTPSC